MTKGKATEITVDLSPSLLEKLDWMADHYQTTRKEALRLAIVHAIRAINSAQPIEGRDVTAAISRLEVASADIVSAIEKIKLAARG